MKLQPQRPSCPYRAQGFTLVEVMVALIIIAVGMLGIAKLQGLAMSNTGVARMRSLAAIQATSLASAMHANRAFWAANTAPSFINDNSTGSNAFTLQSGALAPANGCQNIVCSAAQVAGYDVYVWIQSLNGTLPGAKETVTCQNSATQPEACMIQIEWTEAMVGANAQEALVAANNQQSGTDAAQAITHPTYDLYVVP